MKVCASQRTHELREHMRGGDGAAVLDTVPTELLPAHTRLAGVITLKQGCSIGSHAHEGETGGGQRRGQARGPGRRGTDRRRGDPCGGQHRRGRPGLYGGHRNGGIINGENFYAAGPIRAGGIRFIMHTLEG